MRRVMAAAALQQGLVPCPLSCTGALQAVNACGTALLLADATAKEALLAALYDTICAHQGGQRPERVEPRAVKRRPKPHPLLTVPGDQARKKVRRGQQEAEGSAIRFRPYFGDSRNSYTLCGVWIRRWKGGALAASDSLSRVHAVSPDGTAFSPAAPPRRVTWSQAAALSRATHVPTPRHALVPAPLRLPVIRKIIAAFSLSILQTKFRQPCHA